MNCVSTRGGELFQPRRTSGGSEKKQAMQALTSCFIVILHPISDRKAQCRKIHTAFSKRLPRLCAANRCSSCLCTSCSWWRAYSSKRNRPPRQPFTTSKTCSTSTCYARCCAFCRAACARGPRPRFMPQAMPHVFPKVSYTSASTWCSCP